MTAKRFPSRIDSWLVVVFAGAVAVQFVAFLFVARNENDPMAIVLVAATTMLLVLLVGPMLRFTYYSVDGNLLRVVSGPFRWRVAIDEIHGIEPTRSPLSSPAPSLDRLRITYGNGRVRLDAFGQFVAVPKGTWHTAKPFRATRMLFVTPGEGTANRPQPPEPDAPD